MKTERRHELQENELANWLGDYISKIQPYFKTIVGVLVLGAVALLAVSYLRSRSESAKQVGWSTYFDAMNTPDPEAFESVAEAFPGTLAGTWALQRAADLHLDQSLRQMFQDRQAAQQELQAARELYEKVLAASNDPMLQQRANFGLGKCLESQGEFEQAEQRYSEVVSKWPDSQIAALAGERLEQIKQPATRDWYSWFAEQKPVASPLNDPSLFQDLPDLPESPDLQMPAPGQLLGPSGAPDPAPAATSPPPTPGIDLGGDLPDLPTLPSGQEPASDTPSNSEGPLKLDLGDETPTPTEPVPTEPAPTPRPDVESLDLDLDLPDNATESP